MAPANQISIALFIVCLLSQAFPLASQGLLISALKYFDTGVPDDSLTDTYRPFYSFVLSASAVSCLFYIYLLIAKISAGKEGGRRVFD